MYVHMYIYIYIYIYAERWGYAFVSGLPYRQLRTRGAFGRCRGQYLGSEEGELVLCMFRQLRTRGTFGRCWHQYLASEESELVLCMILLD
jgi:hypothetical protein